MEIHNLMEELVHSTVEEVSREDQAGPARYCTSEECRTDVLCYVLNRVSPRYVSSGRGLAHLTAELRQDQQLKIDLVRLAHEGLHRVSVVRRTYYDGQSSQRPGGACFNFPTIKGRLLDGSRFMPIAEVNVELRRHGELVAMFDERWSNPYHISEHTPGTYIFWPAPVDSSAAGQSQDFEFELRVAPPGYDELIHTFAVTLQSEDRANTVFSLERDHNLPDLYLFPV